MRYILDRLAERNTWVGLIALASALGASLSPEQSQTIATVGTTVVGLVLAGTKG